MSANAGSGRPLSPWLPASAVMLSSFMVYLDGSVVNLSMPHIAGSLSSTVHEATWVLTSYLAANAVILPCAGWLAGRLGRKRVILASVLGFTVASTACGLATSMPLLIVFRVLQGLTGGMLQPLSMAVMLEAFSREDRGKAMGFWSAGITLAPVLGPVIGGWLTETSSWRWVFLVNIPVGLLGAYLIQRWVHDPPYVKRTGSSVDIVGICLLFLSIGALQVFFDRGQDEDWLASRLILTLLVVGVAATIAMIVWELRSKEPIIDLRVFRLTTFAAGVLISTIVMFVLYASMVVMPLLLQTQIDYSPLQAGLVLAPRGFGAMIAFPLVGLLVRRYDPRLQLAFGLVLGAITMFWLAGLNADLGYWDLFVPQLLQGIALGFLFVPVTTVMMDPISLEGMGNATSVSNTLRNFGSSIGIAITTTFVARQTTQHYHRLSESVTYDRVELTGRGDALRDALESGGVDPLTAETGVVADLLGLVTSQAGQLAYFDAFRLLGWIFVLSLPLALLLRTTDDVED